VKLQAQGWYRDPYAIHEDRCFSDGTPTKLVRDGGQEGYDPPPDRPLPDCELVSAESADGVTAGSLRRGDDAFNDDPPYDAERARDDASPAFDMSGGAM